MRKTRVFKSFSDFEEWTEQFENTSDYMYVPIVVDDGWKVAVDFFTECKSWKTALKRFRKTFSFVNEEIPVWIDTMEESCSNGCFKDVDGWKPANTLDPDDINECAKNGTYGYGVEENSEGCWYIYLNISGVYAGYPKEETK